MSGLLIEPVVEPSRWALFAALFAGFMVWNVAVSTGRRHVMGLVRFTAARSVQLAVPLAGVVVVRSGFRHAYIEDGRGWWEAMWLSLAWMLGFIIAGRLVTHRMPPFAGLMREMRAADRQVWRERLGRVFGKRA